MGNFHCIPDGCARVVYQKYQLGGIRYRYPGQNWIYVDGDDYQIEIEQETGDDIAYGVSGYMTLYANGQWYYENQRVATISPRNYKILNLDNPIRFELVPELYQHAPQAYVDFIDDEGNITSAILSGYVNNSGWIEDTLASVVVQKLVYTQKSGNNYDVEAYQYGVDPEFSQSCNFKVFKEEETVHEETREDCPEVEILDGCQLSDIHEEIIIDKLSYLERIEIRNQSINTVYVSPVEAPFLDTQSLPDECLNIYKTITGAPPFLSDYVLLPGAINPYQFIAQICSPTGCPAPEYEVICDCECQSCPDGSCAVECDGQICCYDTTTGQAVTTIPIENYCEGV